MQFYTILDYKIQKIWTLLTLGTSMTRAILLHFGALGVEGESLLSCRFGGSGLSQERFWGNFFFWGGAGPSSFGRQQRAEVLCPTVQC